jgi:hypothetical protein
MGLSKPPRNRGVTLVVPMKRARIIQSLAFAASGQPRQLQMLGAMGHLESVCATLTVS